MGDSNSSYETYYHHTDEESAKKILQSGYIKQSDPKYGDAVYGPGTYVTKIGPDVSQKVVAKNNYDGISRLWEGKIKSGKTDVAFKMDLPKAKVRNCSATSNRDVHLYEGDLPLSDARNLKVIVRGQEYTH